MQPTNAKVKCMRTAACMLKCGGIKYFRTVSMHVNRRARVLVQSVHAGRACVGLRVDRDMRP
jgi:hypothetical protein